MLVAKKGENSGQPQPSSVVPATLTLALSRRSPVISALRSPHPFTFLQILLVLESGHDRPLVLGLVAIADSSYEGFSYMLIAGGRLSAIVCDCLRLLVVA